MSHKGIDEIADFDFGFSFTDDMHDTKAKVETLETARLTDQQQISELKARLEKLYKSIIPFLDNLCKDPDKATIHWPNRVEKIESYKNKLKSIVEGN